MEEVTFYAVSKWYKKEFQRAGWVMISGNADKIADYLKHLEHLKTHLWEKFKVTKDHDNKNDLRIMLEKTENLIAAFSML